MPLTDDIKFLKGVGPARANDFYALGVRTIADLLFTFPRAINDLSTVTTIADAPAVGDAVIVAEMRNLEERCPRRGKIRSIVHAMFTDRTGEMEAVWFNSPWVKEQLAAAGKTLLLYGKVNRKSGWLKMEHPRFEPTVAGIARSSLNVGRMVPVYPCTGRLNQNAWRQAMNHALTATLAELPELYPPDFLREQNLTARQDAVRNMHFPDNDAARAAARERLAWDEALLMQLAIAQRRAAALNAASGGRRIIVTPEIDAHLRRLFPFRPTAAQEKVLREITADLAAPLPMRRLLQGDVGSGKTAVAIYALLAAVANGAQAVLMAPTGIVAAQHFMTLEKFLAAGGRSKVRLKLLTSGMKKREREWLKTELAQGGIDLLVATHAAIESDIQFKNLALAVIDEQHKFGVAQRDALANKGVGVKELVMTATPIPRSLALTVYGDLDVSVIDELPPGRQPVRSTLINSRQLPQAWDFIRAELAKGRQAFIVSPLREENEDYLSATEAFENFRSHELSGFALGLLHGQMTREEQAAAMDEFRAGKIQALVCTVVIEVGVDIPNANTMLVLHAERFGLAQLHQLRGRIGRGTDAGHFIMLSDGGGEITMARLQVMTQTMDGFKIAQEDLRLRGPGEFLGTKQHGLPEFKALDLVEDLALINRARETAKQILPELATAKFAALNAALAAQTP
jgi:ATP-dependent DNA helicase RecG